MGGRIYRILYRGRNTENKGSRWQKQKCEPGTGYMVVPVKLLGNAHKRRSATEME